MNSSFPKNKIYTLILFLVWPLLGLITALRNYRFSWAKNIVWLFIIFYGYTLVISNPEMDANRYRDYFVYLSTSDVGFSQVLSKIYSNNPREQYLDIVRPLVDFGVASITKDYRILFGVYGCIFGFFYSRNIWFLIEKSNRKLNFLSFISLITFALIVGIWQINGFRFWTATHVFTYGCLHYFFGKKKNGFWIVMCSMLVHFSYFLPVIAFGLYRILGNRLQIYFLLFAVSLLISEINLESVRSLFSFLPNTFSYKIEAYTRESYAERISQFSVGINWYAKYYTQGVKLTTILYLFIVYFKKFSFFQTRPAFFNYFNFLVLLFTIANMSSLVPSGGRFITLVILLVFSLLFFQLQLDKYRKALKRLILFTLPLILLFNIVEIRNGFDTIGINTIISNPVVAPFLKNEKALIQLIK